ncbi:hypothetical protein Tco_0189772 [Tanacetum coccineum]
MANSTRMSNGQSDIKIQDYFKDKMPTNARAQENGASTLLDEEQGSLSCEPSYDSNTPFEVQDHDTFVNHMDEYHKYVEDNEEHVVQSNVSSVRDDALMTILDEMHEQGVQSRLANKPNMVVKDSVTSELARYKELVGEYEKRAKFELTDRERKIDEQMRIIISDRNRKETSLKSELHSAQILLNSTVGHYKSKTEEVTILKKDFKQKEDKFLEEFLDIKRLKEKVEDRLYKQDQSVQTVHMLCKPKSFYDEKNKVAIGYKNPLCRTHPCKSKFNADPHYNGHVLVMSNHARPVVHDSEDTREIAEITRKRMLLKMQSPLSPRNIRSRKRHKIRDLKVLVANVNDRSCVTYNAKDVTALIEQNDCVRVELEKVKQHYKELYDSIKITRAHTSEKTSTMLNEIESLKAQLRSKVSCFTSDSVKPKVLAPGMYAIDVKPIPHPLKNNRRVNTSTEASGSKPRSNTKKNRILPAKKENKKENHEMCVVNILNSVNATPTVKIVLNKGKQIWKPKGKLSDNSLNKTKQVWKATGKLFANVGYQWRPTGKKFALGELCPLTKLSVQCRTGHPLVSGLRLFKTYDGESFKA